MEEGRRKKRKRWRSKEEEEEEERGGADAVIAYLGSSSSGQVATGVVALYTRRGLTFADPNLFIFLFFNAELDRVLSLFISYYFNWTAQNGGRPCIGPCSDRYILPIPYHVRQYNNCFNEHLNV